MYDPEGLSRGRGRIHGERGSASLYGGQGGEAVPPWGPGGQGAKPPEADDILTFETPTLALFFTCFLSFLVFNCDI